MLRSRRGRLPHTMITGLVLLCGGLDPARARDAAEAIHERFEGAVAEFEKAVAEEVSQLVRAFDKEIASQRQRGAAQIQLIESLKDARKALEAEGTPPGDELLAKILPLRSAHTRSARSIGNAREAFSRSYQRIASDALKDPALDAIAAKVVDDGKRLASESEIVWRVRPEPRANRAGNVGQPAQPGQPHMPGGKAPVQFRNSVGMEFVVVPAGQFLMQGKRVGITKPFMISTTEVTQRQWETIMATAPWHDKPQTRSDPSLPATYVSHGDAIDFCRTLAAHEAALGGRRQYDLPTQAQWEYACRAGADSKWCFGDDEKQLDQFAWYDANTIAAGAGFAQPVHVKTANRLGIHDMHGNVWEWCLDGPLPNTFAGGLDPRGLGNHPKRIACGGGFGSNAEDCGAAASLRLSPDSRGSQHGFRVIAF